MSASATRSPLISHWFRWTAKAVVEVPAPWAGRITTLHGNPGDVIAVGAPLADIDAASDVRDAGTVVGTVPRLPDMPAAVDEHRSALADRDERSKVSPAVRRLAQDLRVALASISGTGPGGVITGEDVRRAATSAQPMERFEQLRGVRRAMADAMATAGTQSVPATVTDEAIIDAWPTGADPTIRLIRAVAAGCKAAPSLNAWYDPDRRARRLHDRVDLGIAMETEDGLFAPVLRTAGD